jgi:hypothetical protein
MTARRSSTTAVVAVLASVLLVALLVTWAASIGPGDVLTGDGPATHRASPTSTTPTESLSGSPSSSGSEPERASEPSDHPVLYALAIAVEVALGLLVLIFLVRMVRRLVEAWATRRRPEAPPETVAFDVLEVAHRVTDEIARDADAQRAVLLGGSPRNGIVECWHRFEQQAAAAGLARGPWETSSEFTLRMLDLAEADSATVEALAVLYREARFSGHPMDEDARAAAVRALDAIHAGLKVRARGGS